MSTSDKEIKVNVTAATAGLAAGLQEAQAQVARSTAYIRENINGLGSVVERIKVPFIALAAVLAGGEIFKGVIEKTEDFAVQLEKMHASTGIGVEQLSALKYAADASHLSFETLNTSLGRFSKNVYEAGRGTGTSAEALDRLKIHATDAHGQLLPLHDILLQVADRFKNMPDGVKKTAIAFELFGRSAGAGMVPFLNQGIAGITALEQKAKDLGATMTADGVEKAVQYAESMKDLDAVGRGLAQRLGVALMPALTDIANAFVLASKDGGSLNVLMKGISGAMKLAAFSIIATVGSLRALNTMMSANLLKAGEFSNAWASAKKQIADTRAELEKLFAKPVPATPSSQENGGDNTPAGGKPKSQLPDFQEQWLEIKDQQSAFAENLLQMERDFWQRKLEAVGKGSKDYLAIHRRVVELTHQIQKQDLADKIAALNLDETEAEGNAARIIEDEKQKWLTIAATAGSSQKEILAAKRAYLKAVEAEAQRSAQAQITIARDMTNSQIALERARIDGQKQLGTLSDADALAALRSLLQQEYQANFDALAAEMALANGNADKIAALNAKIAELNAQHNIAIVQNTTQATLAIKNQWESVFSSITNAVQTSVNGIIQGTRTMSQALSGLARSMLLEFASYEAGRLASHIATELAITQASTVGATTRASIDWWAATESVAASAWSAIKNIAAYAAQAIAAAYAAISAIPFVGPFLAPGIAAGIGIAVMSQAGKIASASGGYDIPSGVNPLTQLHANEMVIPANLANGLRGIIANGGASGGGGGTQVHYHITATDAASFEALCKRNPAAIAGGVKNAVRGGHLQGGPV